MEVLNIRNFDEATIKKLIKDKSFEEMPHNSLVKKLIDTDGSTMLYVSSDDVEEAIVSDVKEYELGYRLPVDKELIHNGSPHFLKQLEEDTQTGNLIGQHYAIRNLLHTGSRSVEETVFGLLSDEDTASSLRQRWFNHMGLGEQVITDDNGNVQGYAYAYRPNREIKVEDIRPDLSADGKNGDVSNNVFSNAALENFSSSSGDIDAYIRDEYFAEVSHLVKQHGYMHNGAYRIVFDRGDAVVKIPLNATGLSANSDEFSQSQVKEVSGFEGVPIAKSHYEYTKNGMPYLVMEKVEKVHDIEIKDMPDWASKIDDYQLGRTKDGRLVAYDL